MPNASLARRLALLICPLLFAAPVLAQNATDRQIGGIVRDAGTRAPLPGVAIEAAGQLAVTDGDGRFVLRVPPGLLRVELTLDGFYPLSTDIDVTQADAAETELLLVPRSGFASSVDVVGASPPAAAPSAVAVAPAEVLNTPGALDNVFRTLQTLPGVSATDEFGSRLAVRGGAPDQNLTLMDGVEIHDPYRLFGLTSAFNPETISRFELATGGFGVKYGDRLSSLLLVDNREGTRSRAVGGSASLSVTDANVVLEGELPGKANGSWLVSARRTYYDLIAARITGQDFPGFSDQQAKGVWELAPGRTVSVFALRSRQDAALTIDEADARGEFRDNTQNGLLSLRFDTSVGGRGQSRTTVSSSDTASSFGVDAAFENRSQRSNSPDDSAFDVADVRFDRTLALRDLSLRQDTAWALGAHLVEAGGELHGLGTELTYAISGDRNPAAVNGSSPRRRGRPSGLAASRLATSPGAVCGCWIAGRRRRRSAVEAGVRVDGSGVSGETRLSPRVNAVYRTAGGTRLRGAVGRYTQSPGYEKLVSADYVLDLTIPTPVPLRSEQSLQTSVGIEHDVAGVATVRLEGYYKQLSHMLIGRLESDAELQARAAQYDFPEELAYSVPSTPIITTVPTNDGRGRAYGFDLFVTRMPASGSARVRGWASYTWGRAERDAYGRNYPFEYDRRHAFSAVASYRLSNNWGIASTVRVASGFPRTAPLGLIVAGTEDTTDADGDGRVDELIPARDRRRAAGLRGGLWRNRAISTTPAFRCSRAWTCAPRGDRAAPRGGWELYVEVINLLNRENAGTLDAQLEYDPTSDRPKIVESPDQGIPRFPTVGVRFRF